jgi:hypothetical protein
VTTSENKNNANALATSAYSLWQRLNNKFVTKSENKFVPKSENIMWQSMKINKFVANATDVRMSKNIVCDND